MAPCAPNATPQTTTLDSFLIVHVVCSDVLLEIPASMFGRSILAYTEFAALSTGGSEYAPGSAVDSRVVRWLRIGSKVALLTATFDSWAGDSSALQQGVEAVSLPIVIAVFDVVNVKALLLELASAASDESLRTPLEHTLEQALDAGEILDAALAQSEEHRHAFWRLRETIPEAQTRAGGSLKHDVSVPVSAVATLLAEGSEAARTIAPGVRICAYGHVGDGNLHFNFQAPPGETLQSFVDRHGAAISHALYERVAGLGGSVCAEHGVGQLKRDLLARYADPSGLAIMRALKAALDPDGLMNPGKVL